MDIEQRGRVRASFFAAVAAIALAIAGSACSSAREADPGTGLATPTSTAPVIEDPTLLEKSAGQALSVVTSGAAHYVRPVDPSLPIG